MANSDLNKQLLRQLECPVCFEMCKPPIYMCKNGHAVCDKCQPKLKKCSTCRAPGKMTARCVPLESIVELVTLPCPNQAGGCRQTVKYAEMDGHLKQGGFECHVCGERKFTAPQIGKHVQETHPTAHEFMPASGVALMRTTAPFQSESRDATNQVMFRFDGEIFWLAAGYVSATRIHSTNLSVVSHDSQKAAGYRYSVQFKSEECDNGYSLLCRANVAAENAASVGLIEIVLPQSLMDECADGFINYELVIMKSPDNRRGQPVASGGSNFRGQNRGKNRGRGNQFRKQQPQPQPQAPPSNAGYYLPNGGYYGYGDGRY